ncbi:hypothetical protein H6788_01565 [Candidatus Nomurabacteria bacterium]|nr:hypothetical protein [Candidatus Nomurabacteria bacterium]MCB9819614.1 hypothetical protein [Candidatus Nomurabacteria bacterium]
MKRTIFIISGSIVLLLVFSMWVFLLLFGTPQNIEDAFTNLGLGSDPTPITSDSNQTLEQTAQLNIDAGTLVQLTTKPVAGHRFLSGASSTTDKLLYAERGVGHIYEIDIASSVENRISAKTFLAVIDAIFSPDGKFVALVSETENGTAVTLENLEDEVDYDIPTNAKNLEFISDTELRYAVTSQSGTVGYSFDLTEITTDQIFSIPLTDIDIIWGTDETLVINKPASRLRGGLFRINGSQMSRVGESGYSLRAIASPSSNGEYILTVANLNRGGVIESRVFNETTGELRSLSILAWPEKCVFDTTTQNSLWCASSASELSRDSQSDWYKGLVTFSDLLWRVDTVSGEATLVENFVETSGRYIDVTDISIDQNGRFLLFKNKIDDSLWIKKTN